MTITFCGHAQVMQPELVRSWLYDITKELIKQGASVFYLGGYGAFDSLAASVLADHKKHGSQIERLLIVPYPTRRFQAGLYDGSLYPPLETVPKKLAIVRRNRWMVDSSDVVVAYVLHGWGGAAATLQYARQKQKTIYLFPS